MAPPATVSVVVATHNRAEGLAALIDSLRRQTLGPDEFEVILVDDGSSDATPEVIARAEREGPLRVRGIRREVAGGPAAARNDGWRAATAPFVAFTDDDCVVAENWLETGLAELREGEVVQGRTDPNPEQMHRWGPFSRTREIHAAGPEYETCNIFYPRCLLEELGGFDDERFPAPGGEDTDLAWRAKAAGWEIRYAPEAQVFHDVAELGPLRMLEFARRREQITPVFAKHPQLRRAQLHLGLFYSPTHEHLLRFALAVALRRRMPVVALLLARPYVVRLVARRSRGLIAPFVLAYDLVEMYAVVRGAIRNRVLVL